MEYKSINTMLFQIIKHTPPWVFILFLILLVMGYQQSKTRVISQGKITILPTAMFGLSLYGVISAFGVGLLPISLISWVGGISIAGLLNRNFPSPLGVTYSTNNKSFTVPGSWNPFILMMAIFFTKYTVGVIIARQLPILNEKSFIAAISLCYGFIGGIFLFRAITIFRSKKNNPSHQLCTINTEN